MSAVARIIAPPSVVPGQLDLRFSEAEIARVVYLMLIRSA
jgi:hypothetical protein